ncbi:ROK family protein [Patescibacteria group bacterium]|nr:ROK family protein [Patescibacteria group bacterium]
MYLLFDIGGTKMRLAVSKDSKSIGEPVIVPTPKSFEAGMTEFQKIAGELCKGKKVQAVAGGVAGPLDKERTILVNSPHLPLWIKQPLKKDLEKMLDAPVYLENDTALVGLGEATRGAGQGHSIIAYMTVSTGVGGVRIVDGVIDRSAMGFEPGHQIIEGGLSLEQLISGSAIAARYGKDPREIRNNKIWDEVARMFAVGLNNTIVHWSPDVFVLGGPMITGNPSIPMDAIQKYTKETLKIFPEPPPIKMSTLGDIGGLYGALELAKQQRFTAT